MRTRCHTHLVFASQLALPVITNLSAHIVMLSRGNLQLPHFSGFTSLAQLEQALKAPCSAQVGEDCPTQLHGGKCCKAQSQFCPSQISYRYQVFPTKARCFVNDWNCPVECTSLYRGKLLQEKTRKEYSTWSPLAQDPMALGMMQVRPCAAGLCFEQDLSELFEQPGLDSKMT